jgi:uncharacterized membrane protein
MMSSEIVPGEYSQQEVTEGKPLAAVGYVPICCLPSFLVPMFAAKENKYAQFHARQGALFYLLTFGSGVGVFIFRVICLAIGHGLGCAGAIVVIAWSGMVLVMMVIGVINALQGQAKDLPFIGMYAKKLPF